MTPAGRRILVTGLADARDAVLALPRLAGLRAAERAAKITVRVPAAAADLVHRLKLADTIWRREDRHPLTWLWHDWRGRFDLSIAAAREAGEKDLWAHVPFKNLQDDLTFMLPPGKFVVLAPTRRLPAVRMASLAKRLAVEGYAVVLAGGEADANWRQAFLKAAPEARDLTARIGLPEAVSLARAAACWLGAADAMTLLVSLSGARTIILCEGEDPARQALPAGQSVWVQADDLSLLSIGDMMRVVLP